MNVRNEPLHDLTCELKQIEVQASRLCEFQPKKKISFREELDTIGLEKIISTNQSQQLCPSRNTNCEEWV